VSKNSEVAAELTELKKNEMALKSTIRKAGVMAYNLERSFVENVKEISGTGLTAKEARQKWGLDEI